MADMNPRSVSCPSWLAVFLSILLSLSSCRNDGYQTGDGPLSYLRADYVDMEGRGGVVTTIVTDEGVVLPFMAGLRMSATNDTIIRCLLYYSSPEDGTPVEILSSKPVAVLLPVADSGIASADPVHLTSAWLARSGRYVNLQLGVMTGNDKPASASQQLQLNIDSISQVGRGHLYVSLRHDQGGVPQYYTEEVLLSIPMPQQDSLTLDVNTYSGVVRRTFIR